MVFTIHTLLWYVSISVKQQDVSCFTSSIWGPYYDAGRPLWCLQLAGKVHPMAVALDSTDLPRILVGGWLWIFESLGPMLFESKSKSFRWVSEQDCISILIPAKSRKSFFFVFWGCHNQLNSDLWVIVRHIRRANARSCESAWRLVICWTVLVVNQQRTQVQHRFRSMQALLGTSMWKFFNTWAAFQKSAICHPITPSKNIKTIAIRKHRYKMVRICIDLPLLLVWTTPQDRCLESGDSC